MLHDLKQKMKNYKDMMHVQFPQEAATNDTTSGVFKQFSKYLNSSDKEQKPLDVPDFLKCAISDELMDDPVVIQSGHTYERAMIVKHF